MGYVPQSEGSVGVIESVVPVKEMKVYEEVRLYVMA